MTNKERMLQMVLDDKQLQELYGYDKSEYEDLETAYNSRNIVVGTVARIIKNFKGSTIDADMKQTYTIIVNYINENYLYDF